MSNHKSSVWPGVILIIIGALLLVNKLTEIPFGWPQIYPVLFVGLGIMFFGSVINRQNKGAVFPGTILLLMGVLFLLRNWDLVPYRYVRDIWPIMAVILGLAFLSLFFVKPSDWGVLIPASIFLFFGAAIWLDKLDIIYIDIWDLWSNYWPVLLIIIGIGIIAGSLRSSTSRPQPPEPQ
ncbi:MAG: DUF5668 domain-containing protein [candidate division KSB1 bacterium]|nr:DUF5668 domain-containing protein [candidate division KSB1 bacterium]MDZ7340409.1 DUF5668 domain-containing protein [candidate division KSB1 bacterium]